MVDLVQLIEYISLGIGLVGIFIVLWGVIVGLVEFIRAQFAHLGRHRKLLPLERIRIDLGRYLLLGLEFLVAGDVVRTVALDPTLGNVAVLGLLVLVRTFLSWSLTVEIEGRWPWQPRKAVPSQRSDRPSGDTEDSR